MTKNVSLVVKIGTFEQMAIEWRYDRQLLLPYYPITKVTACDRNLVGNIA